MYYFEVDGTENIADQSSAMLRYSQFTDQVIGPRGDTCQNFDRDARPIFWV